MATRTIAVGGGNWNTTTTWEENAVPTASDAVIARPDNTSGQLTMDGATGKSVGSLDFTNYTNTLTLTGALSLTCSGNVTFGSGMTITGTGTTLNCSATSTLTSNGKTWTGKMTFTGGAGPVTFTLADTWTVNGLVTWTTSPVLNGAILNCAGSATIAASSNLTGTTQINMTGTGTLTGSTGTIANNLAINTAGTITLAGSNLLYLTGTFTYYAGSVVWGATFLQINGNCTLDLGQMTGSSILPDVRFLGAATVTLNSKLYSTLLTYPNANVTWAGSYGFDVGSFLMPSMSAARTITFAANVEYKVNTALTLNQPYSTKVLSLQSSSGGTKALFTLGPGATQDVAWVNPTDIDSSRGQTIFTYKGTIATSFGWLNTLPISLGQASYQLGM